MAQETPDEKPIEAYKLYRLETVKQCVYKLSKSQGKLFNRMRTDPAQTGRAISEMIRSGTFLTPKRRFADIFVGAIKSRTDETPTSILASVTGELLVLAAYVNADMEALSETGKLSILIEKGRRRTLLGRRKQVDGKKEEYVLTKGEIMKAAEEALKLATAAFKEMEVPYSENKDIQDMLDKRKEESLNIIGGESDIPERMIDLPIRIGYNPDKAQMYRDRDLNDVILFYQIIRLSVEGGGEEEEAVK